MKPKRRNIFSLTALALGGLLTAAPLVARAAQPATAQEADQRAEHFTKLADNYKSQGGAVEDGERSARPNGRSELRRHLERPAVGQRRIGRGSV